MIIFSYNKFKVHVYVSNFIFHQTSLDDPLPTVHKRYSSFEQYLLFNHLYIYV